MEIDFEEVIEFDRISIFEKADMTNLGDGFSNLREFRIKEYQLQVYHHEEWTTFYTGDYIQACKIINLPLVIKGNKIRINILNSEGNPGIYHFTVSLNSTKSNRSISERNN